MTDPTLATWTYSTNDAVVWQDQGAVGIGGCREMYYNHIINSQSTDYAQLLKVLPTSAGDYYRASVYIDLSQRIDNGFSILKVELIVDSVVVHTENFGGLVLNKPSATINVNIQTATANTEFILKAYTNTLGASGPALYNSLQLSSFNLRNLVGPFPTHFN